MRFFGIKILHDPGFYFTRFVGIAFLCYSFFLTSYAEPVGRLRVVTTIFPAYAVASAVAGDQAIVENLLPAGVGPHDYQLTVGDLRTIQKAQVIVQNGIGLEHWLERAFKSNPTLLTVNLSDGLHDSLIRDPIHAADHHSGDETKHHEEGNPHLWLDPKLMIRSTTNVLRAFQKADPPHAAVYASNATVFVQSLQKLDQELSSSLAPLTNRGFVTLHDAFAYFARAYQLKVVGVLETTPDVSPPPRYLGELMRRMRQEKVSVIFAEPNSPKRLAERIAADLKIRVALLDTLESGALKPGEYEAAMRRNATVLIRELGAATP